MPVLSIALGLSVSDIRLELETCDKSTNIASAYEVGVRCMPQANKAIVDTRLRPRSGAFYLSK